MPIFKSKLSTTWLRCGQIQMYGLYYILYLVTLKAESPVVKKAYVDLTPYLFYIIEIHISITFHRDRQNGIRRGVFRESRVNSVYPRSGLQAPLRPPRQTVRASFFTSGEKKSRGGLTLSRPVDRVPNQNNRHLYTPIRLILLYITAITF